MYGCSGGGGDWVWVGVGKNDFQIISAYSVRHALRLAAFKSSNEFSLSALHADKTAIGFFGQINMCAVRA